MAHRTLKSSYALLAERLNRFPQGAPPSELLFAILKMLFSEREAGLVSLLPIKPFDEQTAARAWKTSRADARRVLDELASRAILVDVEREGRSIYCLPPPMAGFFEFSMMRVRPDLDQRALAELFYRYMNVEEDFIKALFATGPTQLGRAFVQEPAVGADDALLVLDYERASEVIKTATHIGVGMCYCRHKMMHLGRACDALVSANDPRGPVRRKAKVDESVCLGCGVCVRACPKGALALRPREARIVTPVSSAHRAVLMAMERGMLQDLVFDNRAMASHRAMAAILGAILRLSPAKRLMASEQLRSKYLAALLGRLGL